MYCVRERCLGGVAQNVAKLRVTHRGLGKADAKGSMCSPKIMILIEKIQTVLDTPLETFCFGEHRPMISVAMRVCVTYRGLGNLWQG